MRLTLTGKSYSRFAAVVLSCLIVADIAAIVSTHVFGRPSAFGLVPLVRMDNEDNLPTILAGLNILFAALLLAGLAQRSFCLRDGLEWPWTALAGAFAFLALDELVSIHELINHPLKAAFGVKGEHLKLWVAPYVIAAAGIGLLSVRLLIALPFAVRWRMVAAGVIYLSGAAGFEWIGGVRIERLGGVEDITGALLTTVEESLEVAGMILFVSAIIRHVEAQRLRIAFGVGQPPGGPASS